MPSPRHYIIKPRYQVHAPHGSRVNWTASISTSGSSPCLADTATFLSSMLIPHPHQMMIILMLLRPSRCTAAAPRRLPPPLTVHLTPGFPARSIPWQRLGNRDDDVVHVVGYGDDYDDLISVCNHFNHCQGFLQLLFFNGSWRHGIALKPLRCLCTGIFTTIIISIIGILIMVEFFRI